MNLLFLTAGAANMYCGSCLRDNALATELLRRGHAVTLLPLYTPTRVDERNVSDAHVFFGGISGYLEQTLPVFRRTPRWLDRLWDRPSLIRAMSGRAVRTDPAVLGALTVSMLRGEHGHQRKEFAKLVAWLRDQPRPDVITLPNSLLISLAAPLARALGAPICCTLQGEDLFLEGLPDPWRSEARDLIRAQVPHVDAFVAVSDYYAAFMRDYLGIPETALHVAPLGIRVDDTITATPKARTGTFTIGYFARIAPEKGLHRLCTAYRRLRAEHRLPPARLEAAGYLGAEHQGYLDEISRSMREAGLGDEFHYRGVLDRDEKIAFLHGLDVFSVPTPYHEPKGLFLLEAMACGVPVVQPRCGAFPEIVERTGGGLLVTPDDDAALADGLLQVWRDPALAATLGRQGAAGVRAHYSASSMADGVMAVCEHVARSGGPSPETRVRPVARVPDEAIIESPRT
jgi:glycosyltransferase involved in cell wall biosynthesis